MQIAWWFIFVITIVCYFALAGIVLPKVFFNAGFEVPILYDRGLKNYKLKNGRTVVYEPKMEEKKYVEQYLLSERDGQKVLLCKIDTNIAYLNYSVTLFDDNDKVFQELNVDENIVNRGYTNTLALPEKTMYAMLRVNKFNNTALVSPVEQKFSSSKFCSFLFFTALLTVFEVFFAKFCLANLFGDVFVESFMSSPQSFFITLGIGFCAVLINFASACVYIKSRKRKKVKK